ncbi:hypothetical protein B0H34DRAFT_714809 [Crassisporium funariophilum]|nr:hypothetical protein B0H34DRAFT_714809 [Crassisporium funariophilum]
MDGYVSFAALLCFAAFWINLKGYGLDWTGWTGRLDNRYSSCLLQTQIQLQPLPFFSFHSFLSCLLRFLPSSLAFLIFSCIYRLSCVDSRDSVLSSPAYCLLQLKSRTPSLTPHLIYLVSSSPHLSSILLIHYHYHY